MTEDSGNLQPHRPKHAQARAIGGVLGCATGLAVGKLIGFESLWLGVVLVAGCTGFGVFLAQKISGET